MDTRRHFIQGMLAGLGGSLVTDAPAANPGVGAGEVGPAHEDGAGLTAAVTDPAKAKTGSDVGSLYPFIQSQAVHGESPP